MNTDEIETSLPDGHESNSDVPIDEDRGRGRGREQLLITAERTRKFDLLLHLISNLDEPIVLIGPEGIGKSKIFKSLEIGKLAGWTVCYLEATLHTTFENVEASLNAVLEGQYSMRKDDDPSREFASRLKQLGVEQKSLVLLLDDAGRVEPGLLSRIYQFAIANPALRVVFSITPDDLHVKHSTDPAIDDCHFVEIPPLTREQCGEFLKSLSRSSDVAVSYTAITPDFVHTVYSESHGIPGKILAVLPEVGKTVKVPKVTAMAAYVGLAMVAATAVGISMWGGADKALEESRGKLRKEIVLTKKAEQTASTPAPQLEGLEAEVQSTESLISGQGNWEGDAIVGEYGIPESEQEQDVDQAAASEVEAMEQHVSAANAPGKPGAVRQGSQGLVTGGDTAQLKKSPPADAITARGESSGALGLQPPATVKPLAPDDAQQSATSSTDVAVTSAMKGPDWLLAQSPADFTLQIMAVSKAAALGKIARQYSQLENMAYFKTAKNAKPVFPVVVGVYPSMDAALAAKKNLPPALASAWVRRLKHVHSEIRSHRQ